MCISPEKKMQVLGIKTLQAAICEERFLIGNDVTSQDTGHGVKISMWDAKSGNSMIGT